MLRRLRGPLVLFVCLILATSVLAATKKKLKLPPGATLLQSAVTPSCGSIPTGVDIDDKPLTVVTADDKHVLSTTFDVDHEVKSVPVYKKVGTSWQCTPQDFDLRLYRDPVTKLLRYPGPTLMVHRATDTEDGDSIRVLLQNHLPPFNDKCVWAQQNCDCTATPKPRCCGMVTEPNGMNCFHGPNTTNLHFHGTHVSPQEPQDWVFLQLQPYGSSGTSPHGLAQDVHVGEFQYAVDPLPKNQAEGTHWYHPHKHGSTAEQVGNGMAGALIIKGPFDAWLQKQYNDQLREKTLVVQQIHSLNFTALNRAGGAVIPLINGLLVPQITMHAGEIQRWRIVSATMEASAQLVIDFNGVENDAVQAKQIAMDGVQFSPKNYQCQPLLGGTCTGGQTDLQFRMSPGNRADFLVKAPSKAGRYMVPYEVFGRVDRQGLAPRSRGGRTLEAVVQELTRTALDAVAPGVTQPALLSINVVSCEPPQDCDMKFPGTLPDLPDFLRAIVPKGPGQDLQFQILPGIGAPPSPDGTFGIWVKGQNNDKVQQFRDDCAAFTEKLDPTGGEEWRISQNVNDTGGKPLHVFHIHTNPFQVVSMGSTVYPEPIWQDSITLPNNSNSSDPTKPTAVVTIRQRFEDYTGAYVLHCHFLGHEDRGMMLSVQTVCPDNPDSYSETSRDQKECTFGKFIPALKPCQPVPESGTHSMHERKTKQ